MKGLRALMLGGCLAVTAAVGAEARAWPVRFRGFTAGRMDRSILVDLKNRWNANMVRYMISPVWRAEWTKSRPSEVWERYLRKLPAELDIARELGIAVVLDLHQIPNDEAGRYWESREGLRAFWKDDTNREMLVRCWRQLARICRDRPQVIWFDILNEPLDWDDFPSFPKKWPDWAQAAVRAIREIDRRHPVVIEAGPGGLCWGFRDFPALEGEGIIYSIHNYQPHEYTHQGVSDVRNTDLRRAFLEKDLPWPGEHGGQKWDAKRLERELAPVIQFQKKHRVRVYVGEFGVVRWAPNAAAYLRDSIAIYEKHGWDWTCHSFREWHGWSPEHDGTFSDDEKACRAKGLTDRGRVLMEALRRR